MDALKPLRTVELWQEAVNAQDVARLLDLSAPDIEIIGPRGSGVGHQLLCEWLTRAGLSLTTRRAYTRGQTVVLDQRGAWRDVASSEVIGDSLLASVFRVNERQQVAGFARYDSLSEALASVGLDDDDLTGEER